MYFNLSELLRTCALIVQKPPLPSKILAYASVRAILRGVTKGLSYYEWHHKVSVTPINNDLPYRQNKSSFGDFLKF